MASSMEKMMKKSILMTAAAVFFVSTSASAFAQETAAVSATDIGVECPFGTAPSIENCGFAAEDEAKAIGKDAADKVKDIKEQIRAKTKIDVESLLEAALEADRTLLAFQTKYKSWYESVKDNIRSTVVKDVKTANTAAISAVNNLRSEAYKAVKVN